MEDVMETCWIDSVTMCSRGYKCEICSKNIEFEKSAAKNSQLDKNSSNFTNKSSKE